MIAAPRVSVSQGGRDRHAVQRFLIKSLALSRVSLLEVGSFEGQSALNWSVAIGELCPEGGEVLCVDPWKPYHNHSLLRLGGSYVTMDSALRSGSAYENFLYNASLAHPKAPISHLVGSVEDFEDGLLCRSAGFDVVFIDGDHKASAVRSDIEVCKKLVRVGGVLCGDDLEIQGGDCDYHHALEHAEVTDYTCNFHPGVTVAVWEAFGRVWSACGTWVVQNYGDGVWKIPEVLNK